ncbi:NADPH2:quinone reductase [Sphingobium sp. OAS761]|uniref:NADPH:quinone oxidoreductase family protein n=1 Tax=Sphingobium sp. OAS761 TaxID=2817901 RepID=UPI00209F387B|nr:NADPH:quinone oxidoreductase family protein [Sphingobium sp. OAS761]MCP1472385.1 NADPH2:quinone reductase [Sphingobium sp. OAS761]
MADELGPADRYSLRVIPRRPLVAGEVRVAIHATGVSYADVLTAAGEYQVKPPVPFIPGSEAAGIVIETAPGVTDVAAGNRVVCGGWHGQFAEECVLPRGDVIVIPSGLNLIEAAVFPGSFSTAWHALVDRAGVQPGETVLVLGAAGATGYAAVQVAKCRGAYVIASASTLEKRALAEQGGADVTVDARAADWRNEVKAANGGKPVDVVFDPVGGAATEAAFRSLAWKGRHLVIGFPGGIASLRTNLPLMKGASLIGVNIRELYQFEPEMANANMGRILELASEGLLRPAISRTYPLDDFSLAMAAVAKGESAGRILLDMGQS